MEAFFSSIGLEIPLVVAVAAMLALAGLRLGSGFTASAGSRGTAGWQGIAIHGSRLRARLVGPGSAARRGSDTMASFGGLRLGRSVSGRCLVPTVEAALPQRLSLDEQWGSAARLVAAAISGTRSARLAHEAAAEKLDAATYALETLMAELGGFAKLNRATAEIAVLVRPTSSPRPLRPSDQAAA